MAVHFSTSLFLFLLVGMSSCGMYPLIICGLGPTCEIGRFLFVLFRPRYLTVTVPSNISGWNHKSLLFMIPTVWFTRYDWWFRLRRPKTGLHGADYVIVSCLKNSLPHLALINSGCRIYGVTNWWSLEIEGVLPVAHIHCSHNWGIHWTVMLFRPMYMTTTSTWWTTIHVIFNFRVRRELETRLAIQLHVLIALKRSPYASVCILVSHN